MFQEGVGGALPQVNREYLTLRDLAIYSGLSARTLRSYLHRPVHPLPFFQVDRKILVRRLEFDAWLAQYRRAGEGVDIEQLVEEALSDLTLPQPSGYPLRPLREET